ncbi:MAG: hypothetical protein JW838_15605 [Spirochaetes bacterium]|nr:hypothetical protein [Spirochaetota bacterium]
MASLRNSLSRTSFALIISLAAFTLSCDGFEDMDEEPEIMVQVLCDGGPTNNFTVNYFIDKKFPISQSVMSVGNNGAMSFYPPAKIETVTVTATKGDMKSSLTIIIYKNNELERYANLSGCDTTSYSCSTTLTLDYDINEEDDETKGVPMESGEE